METTHVDLLVLDSQVPDVSGLDVLGWARAHLGERIPVMCLTCQRGEDRLATMFQAGVDDYVVKPVRAGELAARVNALLRRAYPDETRNWMCFQAGAYQIDLRQRTITLDGRTLSLTPREFDLAAILFRHAGRPVPRAQLFRQVWGREMDSLSRSLDTHIFRLRQKLELGKGNGVSLRALYQFGYCLEFV
jgi:DNA-binding response OmpR family regulator